MCVYIYIYILVIVISIQYTYSLFPDMKTLFKLYCNMQLIMHFIYYISCANYPFTWNQFYRISISFSHNIYIYIHICIHSPSDIGSISFELQGATEKNMLAPGVLCQSKAAMENAKKNRWTHMCMIVYAYIYIYIYMFI